MGNFLILDLAGRAGNDGKTERAGACFLLACSAGVFWRGRERVHLIKRGPPWIQTRKRLGERRKYVLGSGSKAERRSNALSIWRRIYFREFYDH